ncbi:MAG: hybrid sensor histidine kinase/response regulator [Magnetococcus sp. DMHC-6]
MIEDPELRELFQAESEEHLLHLDQGLLHLEKNPEDAAILKELFREAHSLKGSSRMLGVADVETLAHRFEDILGAATKGKVRFTAELVDTLTRSLDDIRGFVREAVTGEPVTMTVIQALARMEGVKESEIAEIQERPQTPTVEVKQEPSAKMNRRTPVPPAAPVVANKSVAPASPPIVVPPRVEVSQHIANKSVAPASPPIVVPPRVEVPQNVVTSPSPSPLDEAEKPFLSIEPPEPSSSVKTSPIPGMEEEGRIDTIRVEPRKLDRLLNQAGELSVVKTRIKRRLLELEEVILQWEEVTRVSSLAGEGQTEKVAGDRSLLIPGLESLGGQLRRIRHALYEDEAGLDLVARELEERIRNLRLLPLTTIFNLFPRMVRDLARQQGKQVELVVEGGETTADKRIIEELKSPLTHLVRNAIDHAMELPAQRVERGKAEVGILLLKASRTPTHVVVELIDDGRGLDAQAIKETAIRKKLYTESQLEGFTMAQLYALIFLPGFSTSQMVTDLSGRGVGLDAVRVNVERLKGVVLVDSIPGKGCSFTIRLPITLATTPVFIVSEYGQTFAIPVDFVQTVRRVPSGEVFSLEGRDTLLLDGLPVSVGRLGHLLRLAPPAKRGSDQKETHIPCIFLVYGEERLGLFVDELVSEQEIVLKAHGAILKRVRNISGATILGSGEVCMVLNPQDLIRTIQKQTIFGSGVEQSAEEGLVLKIQKKVLLVEDSITTRTQEKRILEEAGYQVEVAVDGLDALNKLGKNTFDAIISDVQMPNLDGLALTEKIRTNKIYQNIPIILVTSLASDEDMRRGLEVGANAYITKPAFDQRIFLETLERLI